MISGGATDSSKHKQMLPLARIARLAADTAVHRAFNWLHLQEQRIGGWQRELVTIPAPPFGEAARAEWFVERMGEIGLAQAHVDQEGNALALLQPDDGVSPLVLLSAHLDTVFPLGTNLTVRELEGVLYAPGIADNGAGLAGLLAVATAMQSAALHPAANVLLAANVGEEAEGDLRGMRYLFSDSSFASRVCSSIALEGAGTETVVTRALGSRRFRVQITGPGGHSWTDGGVPNPIVALSMAVTAFAALPLTANPRTTMNIGEIRGGTSVTAVPQSAEAFVDIRSTDEEQILSLEVKLHRSVEDAVLTVNARSSGGLRAQINCIGDRPAAALRAGSQLLETVHAVDRHLRLRTEERLGSTDANVPLAMAREAIALGAGGLAGGIHTTNEWYNPRGRELALRRVLLILLDACGGTICGGPM